MSRIVGHSMQRWASIVLRLAAILWVLGLITADLGRVRDLDDLPRWDMAKYGAAGARMSERMAALDPLGLAEEINALGSWPPGFPLLQTPFLLFFGHDFATSRALVGLCFGASLLALGWVAAGLDRRHGPALALLAMALMVSSPMHRLFAQLVMLEVPGTLFGLLALGAYLRAVERPWHPTGWHLCGAASLALLFVKYNYGLMWLAPLGFAELARRRGFQHATRLAPLFEAPLLWLRRIDLARPWHLFLALYLATLVALRVAGGIDTELMGIRLRATSLGNPVTLLWGLILLRAALSPRRTWARCRARWQRLDVGSRVLATWVVVPMAVWMTIPPHLKDFFGFVENRDSGLVGSDAWLFYPRVLAEHYAPWPWLGWLLPWVSLLALVGLVAIHHRPRHRRSRRLGFTALVLLGVAALGLLAVVGHPYKLPRFVFTVLPALWLGAALGMVTLLRRLSSRLPISKSPDSPGSRLVTTLAITALAVGVAGSAPLARRKALADRPAHTVPAATTVVVEALLDNSLEGGTGGAIDEGEPNVLPPLVFGTWNLLSPGLIEWRAIQRDIPATRRPVAARSLGRRLRRALADAERVILLEALDPASILGHSMSEDTRREEAARQRVETDPRWQAVSRQDFPEAGYRLTLLRTIDTGG